MRKIAMLALALLLWTNFSLAQKKGDEAIEARIRQVNNDEVAAFMQKDTKALKNLWSSDFVVTNPLNQFVKGEQVTRMVDNGILAFSSYDRKVEYVRIYKDTAIVAGSEIVGWAGKMPMAGKTSNLRFTSVWMKHGGRWLQVVRHANIVIAPPPGKPL